MRFLTFFIVTLLLFSCSTKQNERITTNTQKPDEEVFIINESTGDTVETGVPLPFNRDKASFLRGNQILQKKGAKLLSDQLNVKNNTGTTEQKSKNAFLKDSSLNITHTVTDSAPPRELIIKPIITTVKEPEFKSILPAIYRDNFQYDIRFISTDQGLPSNKVNDIIKDKDGFMWFATNKGLVRYDGQFIKTYDKSSGLPEDNISCLAIGPKDHLWLGTEQSGYVDFDGATFTNYPIDSIRFGRQVASITFDQNGEMWSTVRFGGFVRYDHEKFYIYQAQQGVMDFRPTTAIAVDKDNTKWITAFGIGLYSIDENLELRRYQENGANVGSSYVNHVNIDRAGNKYFSLWGSIFSIVKKDSVTKYEIKGLPDALLLSNHEFDSKGNVWFSGYGAGLFMYNPASEQVSFYGKEYGLNSEFCTNIYVDNNDIIWVGSEDKGISMLHPRSFKSINQYSGLDNHLVYGICEKPKGTYYFGTNSGLVKKDTIGYHHFNRLENGNRSRIDHEMPDVVVAPDNTLWIPSMNAGTVRVSPDGSFTRFGSALGAQYNSTGIDTASNGHVWLVGMDTRITEMYDTTLIAYGPEDGYFLHFTTDIFIADNDVIWTGSENSGVAKIADNQVTYYTNKEGLSSNTIRHISEDNSNRIWICTAKGLNYYEEDAIHTVKSALFEDDIDFKSIIQDTDNRYWIATEKNLICLVPRIALQENFDINNFKVYLFDKGNGLGNASFLNNSIFIDSENRLMIGSYGGLVVRDLDDIDFDNTPPEVYIESVGINGRFVDYRTCQEQGYLDTLEHSEHIIFDSILPFKNYPKKLELPYYMNHITFEFSALNWDDPHHTNFYYFLEGYEENWNKSKGVNRVDYRNLSYGNYSFHLKAYSRNGQESEQLIYTFEINRPWWHTWWARIVFILLFILIVGGIIKWRTLELRKRQKVLEQEIDIATIEIRKQKEAVEAQKDEVEKAHDELNIKNQEILDSIIYAKRIQSAIMPSEQVFQAQIANSFVFYQPKDIVAGDFYWMEAVENATLFAAADCTGHGVPGAMVSVICNNGLNRAVREFALTDPGKILDKTRELVLEEFKKSEEGVKDGMDIALVSLAHNSDQNENEENNTHSDSPTHAVLKYAGAHNPIWVIRKGANEIEETKANKQPIGEFDQPAPFTTHEIKLNKGDTFYIFSDGYSDQFGGEKGKKMKAANFKKLLLSIQNKTMDEQKLELEKMFNQWKGEFEQLDDVCVIGVRV